MPRPATACHFPLSAVPLVSVLSDASRRLFLSELGRQGWNRMLSTTNYCGRDYPAPGIPQLTASRWIQPDGTVDVEGSSFGQDVRPCNQPGDLRAQTGLGL
jgi:hypothetical protein